MYLSEFKCKIFLVREYLVVFAQHCHNRFGVIIMLVLECVMSSHNNFSIYQNFKIIFDYA